MKSTINGLAVSGDGKFFVVGCEDGKMSIRKVHNLKSIFSTNLKSPLDSVALSATENYIMLGTRDGKIIVMASEVRE